MMRIPGPKCTVAGAVLIAVALAGCSQATGVTPPSAASAAQAATAGASSAQYRDTGKTPFVSNPFYAIVYNFTETKDMPIYPSGPLTIAPNGTIYGTSLNWWQNAHSYNPSGGAVYQVTFSGSATTVQAIYLFDTVNGLYPETGVVRGADGSLYGTTYYGGYGCGDAGCGFLFKLTKQGSGWTLNVLHPFGKTSGDGALPSGPPLLLNGNVYGVTNFGGTKGYGTLYTVAKNGTGYTIIHDFSKNEQYPDGPLVADSNGNLYGTTIAGGAACDGAQGCGVVYEVSPQGSGWSFQELYQFAGINSGDGANPETGVTLLGGNIYGTTVAGGKSKCNTAGGPFAGGCGTIFELASGPSGWHESVLYKWGKQLNPSGLLAVASNALVGTTSYGGSCLDVKFSSGCGTIFSVTTTGSFTTQHEFGGPSGDGAIPLGGVPVSGGGASYDVPPILEAAAGGTVGGNALAADSSGTLWGATSFGGSGGCPGLSTVYGCGMIYNTTTSASGAKRRR
jgi:uncharacterized repeat protein (TIGR03803 family)